MAMISFENVYKGYQLGYYHTSLREAMQNSIKGIVNRKKGSEDKSIFWAINDVTFHVDEGEVLGIIGHNGAGKSTILKLLSKVTYPTSGSIHTKGRMAALIELGAGFHPELTGRENIYLNGSILGLKREEINRQFSDMVSFAGLEQFIDTPIKRYSSGMYVRLAFSVASHVKADLLLVDELLSVGDLDFQQKSLDRMNELKKNGTTIVFISHNLWTVSNFCDRAILLSHGKIEGMGRVYDVIQQYRRQERDNQKKLTEKANGEGDSDHRNVTKFEASILDENDQVAVKYKGSGKLKVKINFDIPGKIQSPIVLIRIWRSDGVVCCTTSNNRKGIVQPDLSGAGSISITLGPLLLVPNDYFLEIQLLEKTNPMIVYATSARLPFQIEGLLSDDMSGFFTPLSTWEFS